MGTDSTYAGDDCGFFGRALAAFGPDVALVEESAPRP